MERRRQHRHRMKGMKKIRIIVPRRIVDEKKRGKERERDSLGIEFASEKTATKKNDDDDDDDGGGSSGVDESKCC